METKGLLNSTAVEICTNGEMLNKSGPTSPKQRRYRAEACNMNNKVNESQTSRSHSESEDDDKCEKGCLNQVYLRKIWKAKAIFVKLKKISIKLFK